MEKNTSDAHDKYSMKYWIERNRIHQLCKMVESARIGPDQVELTILCTFSEPLKHAFSPCKGFVESTCNLMQTYHTAYCALYLSVTELVKIPLTSLDFLQEP